MNKKLFVYIDPGFLSDIGHYKRFATNIHTYFKNLEYQVDIKHYVNKDVKEEDVREFHLIKCFEYLAFINEQTTDKMEIEKRVTSFQTILFTIFDEIKKLETFYDSIFFYMYTSNISYMHSFLLANQRYKIKNSQIDTVLFYLNKEFLKGVQDDLYFTQLHSLNTLMNQTQNSNFFIHLDSDKAIKLYQPYFSKRISPFPIPLNVTRTIETHPTKLKKSTTIVYLGYQSFFHGFHIFYLLYKHLAKQNDFRFIVRANKTFYDKQLASRIQELQEDNNVEFSDSYISETEYENIFNQADIVIIPYLQTSYPVQTSGVFIEALSHHKMVIAAHDTWMAEKIDQLQVGATFDSQRPESIIDAFEKLITQKISFDTKAVDHFNSFYTIEKLFQYLWKQ